MNFFATVFTVENVGHAPMSQPLLSGREFEELNQIEMMGNEVLDNQGHEKLIVL